LVEQQSNGHHHVQMDILDVLISAAIVGGDVVLLEQP
jgi:hypothetical protein